ncbi:TM2 domain-containing protein [Sulfurimonas sp.]|uniref:TM2 domain-containing protein n=1 Tax=Sulfurimonas sp. TaxID=2022749 RepID=UPI003D0AB1D4
MSSEKNKIVAALLAFFLGGFGIHKFYLGCTTAGIIMLVVFLGGIILLGIPSMIIGIIAFIEFILYLIKSDEEFDRIYVKNQKCWF